MKKSNWTDRILLAIGIIPLIWIGLVLITYYKVISDVGSLPIHNKPEPGQYELFLSNYSIWNYGLLLISQIGVIAVPVLLILYKILSNYWIKISKLTVKSVLFGYGGYIVFILFWSIKPLAEILVWYLD